jgi:predicted DNA binding CopG/RHH family protein
LTPCDIHGNITLLNVNKNYPLVSMAGELKQIAVRLPAPLIVRVKRYVRANGLKLQAVFAIALAEYLDRVDAGSKRT